MSIYDVTVTREGRYWVAVVEGLRGAATETQSLASLEGEVRDLISGLTDVDEDAFRVRMNFGDALPADAVASVAASNEWRARMREAEAEYAQAQAAAVARLSGAGVSVRDAASLLHVSAGRVSQLSRSSGQTAKISSHPEPADERDAQPITTTQGSSGRSS